ncbi:hypothetical protein MB02_06850 [Croceicoccus estronivorus]|nr:hypothetical protein MB02_06850 [Croceicoccus estronivorus]
MRRVFERYAALFTVGDTDGIAALYAEDAVVRDPVTSPAVEGRENIRAWYQSAFDSMGGGMEMKLEGAVRIAGHLAAGALIVRTHNHETVMRVETLDVMEFGDDGLIRRMDAYFGPSNYHMEQG